MAKIATIQMCSTTIMEENLAQAATLIAEAAKKGAVLAVLPEAFSRIGEKATQKIEYKEAPGIGAIQNCLAELARKHSIWLVGGTIPLASERTYKVRAACLLFDNNGEVVARYDKMHLFDVKLSSDELYKESAIFEAGDSTVVVDTPVGKLGLCVCYDIRFPTLLSELVRKGAEIIAVPAAFTQSTGQAHWELLARCRAIDTFSYIVGACQGGVHTNGRETYGHSMIVGPWGNIIAEITNPGPGIAYAEIDRDLIYEIRNKIPTLV